jgi:hypothetical protein
LTKQRWLFRSLDDNFKGKYLDIYHLLSLTSPFKKYR